MLGLDLIIVLIIAFIFYKLFFGKTMKEGFSDNSENNEDHEWEYDVDKDLDELLKYHRDSKSEEKNGRRRRRLPVIKPYFVEMQFHTDYRDTMNAFNLVAPAQKQIFNIAGLPVQFTTPGDTEIRPLIKSFITEVNRCVKIQVDDFITPNSGWDEMQPERRMRSGWEKHQEALGLPTNIYREPAGKARIKLISIDRVEKYETGEQTRYVCYLIVQKRNVDEQMVIRISFVINKCSINDDRKLLNNESEVSESSSQDVKIEEIFVIGFMTDHSYGAESRLDDFYNFENIEKDGIIDQQAILAQLKQKYKQRTLAMNGLHGQPDPIYDNRRDDGMPAFGEYQRNIIAMQNISGRADFP